MLRRKRREYRGYWLRFRISASSIRHFGAVKGKSAGAPDGNLILINFITSAS
jgi:hypothetical protein